MRPDGEVVREIAFPHAVHYGHCSAAEPGRPAWVLDGNLTSDLLLWVYYDREDPRIEVIARHGSEWKTLPGQLTHPHPLSSPCGRWVSWNAARGGRTDVSVVRL
jgi:hypothetical protein